VSGQGWETIRAEVMRRIRVRDWPPGALIPNEAALATEFGCARATMSRALRDLAQAGVLERRRRAGTRVALLPVRPATFQIGITRTEVEALGHVHAHRLLVQSRDRTPPPDVASHFGGIGGLLYLETLHLADDSPWLHEVRWLNAGLLPDPAPDFGAVSVNEWLVTHLAYTSGEIAFSAAPASAHEAAVLGVASGAALFVVERATVLAAVPVTLARLAHAPGYRMQTVL